MNDSNEIADVLDRLFSTLQSRRGADPASSYTASLFAKGADAMLKKFGEEATEFVLAAKALSVDTRAREPVVKEAADVLFHLFIALVYSGVSLNEVRAELIRREGVSGHAEKAARSQ